MSNEIKKLQKKFEISSLINFIYSDPIRNIKMFIELQNISDVNQVELNESILDSVGISLCLLRSELLNEDVDFENFDVSDFEDGSVEIIGFDKQIAYLEYLNEELIINNGIFSSADKHTIENIIKNLKFFEDLQLKITLEEKDDRNQEVEEEFLAQIPNYSSYFKLNNIQQPTSFFIHRNDWIDFLNFLEKSSDCNLLLGDTDKFMTDSRLTKGESRFVTWTAHQHPNFQTISRYFNNEPIEITVKRKEIEEDYSEF